MSQSSHPSLPSGLQPSHARSRRGGPSGLSNTVASLLLVALAAYGVTRFEHEANHRSEHVHPVAASGTTPLAAPYNRPIDLDSTCDGRAVCAQMTSCSEAKAFLQNCPGVQLDGNGNGVPCEKNWCTSPLAN